MISPEFSPEKLTHRLLEMLAVVGRARLEWLPGLAGRALPADAQADLLCQPGVSQAGAWLALDPDQAAPLLAALEDADLPHFCRLHEDAAAWLGGGLQAGDAEMEAAFLAAFERLANRLLLDNPADFIRRVEQAGGLPLASSAGRQKMAYFQALALVKGDRYAEAVVVFDRLLAEPDLAPAVRGRALNSRANCYFLTGRLEKALLDYQASLELWRAAGNPLRQGIALLNLGVIAYELQEYPRAETTLTEAVQQFEQAGSAQWLASARNELGLVQRDLGHWNEARACFEAAASQRRKDGAVDSLGAALNNLGEVLLLTGDLAQARATLEGALAAMSTRTWAVDTHLNLGLIHQMNSDLPRAEQEYELAWQLSETIGRRDILSQVHYRLGEALRLQKKDAAALEHFRASVQQVETARQPMQDEGLKISLLGRWQQVYEALVLHCLGMGRAEEAFGWAERSRARAFAEVLAGRRPVHTGPEEAGAQLEPANLDAAGCAELQAVLPPGTVVLSYFTTGVLDRDIPMLRALPAQGPLPEHLLAPAKTILFELTAGSLSARECSLDPNLFSSNSPRGEDRLRFLAPAVLNRLQADLLPEVELAAALEGVTVIPHGPLHQCPFGAMPRLAHGPPLSYAPSATLLARALQARGAGPAQTSRRACLAIGYDGAAGARRLSHSETEARWIARSSGGEAWVGAEPKGEYLRPAAQRYRRLHFSCHGWFNQESPLESYLETGLNERLTAGDVLKNWRECAELVTLSACQTGVSRILRSDEPMGLVRAFLAAGARSVLASQWPVGDLPTLLLMQRFYLELDRLSSAQPARALQAAQRWLAELAAREAGSWWEQSALPAAGTGLNPFTALPPGERPFAHPRHWAGFILFG